ncbi:hypothetical protein LCGC14_1272460 [marine sediment metagenome]|uniref:Right handed beta helix domain-containing protein n=1 Tax=marine sediment metagenome TaxID=412755 RepID=A0A0F9KXR8_9ZZZZ
MLYLKQSIEKQRILLGPFISSSDGITPKTGLDISRMDIQLNKHEKTTFTYKNKYPGALEIDIDDPSSYAGGYYYCELDSVDTNVLGRLIISVKIDGALIVWHEFMVVTTHAYNMHVAETEDYVQHVDDISGNDSNSGTSEGDAVLTVQQAVDNAATGDTIIIHPGSYSEEVTVNNKILCFKGTNRAGCRIQAVGAGETALKFTGSSDGSTIENLYLLGDESGLDVSSIDDIVVRNCRIWALGTGSAEDALLAVSSLRLLVEDSYLRSEFDVIQNSGGSCIVRGSRLQASGGTNAAINCILTGNTSDPEQVSLIEDCTLFAEQDNTGVNGATGLKLQGPTSVVNCTIHCSCGSLASGNAVGINLNDAEAMVSVSGCSIYTKVTHSSSRAIDIQSNASSRVSVSGTLYDDSKLAISGTLLTLPKSTMIYGTVDDAQAPTTTTFEADDITEATANHYNGRIVIFTSGALLGQATDITDYELNGANGKFTVTELTEAPLDDDTFVIV